MRNSSWSKNFFFAPQLSISLPYSVQFVLLDTFLFSITCGQQAGCFWKTQYRLLLKYLIIQNLALNLLKSQKMFNVFLKTFIMTLVVSYQLIKQQMLLLLRGNSHFLASDVSLHLFDKLFNPSYHYCSDFKTFPSFFFCSFILCNWFPSSSRSLKKIRTPNLEKYLQIL